MPHRYAPDGDNEWIDPLYQHTPAVATMPDAWVDLDQPPTVPFGFQIPKAKRRLPMSRQARASTHRRSIR